MGSPSIESEQRHSFDKALTRLGRALTAISIMGGGLTISPPAFGQELPQQTDISSSYAKEDAEEQVIPDSEVAGAQEKLFSSDAQTGEEAISENTGDELSAEERLGGNEQLLDFLNHYEHTSQ